MARDMTKSSFSRIPNSVPGETEIPSDTTRRLRQIQLDQRGQIIAGDKENDGLRYLRHEAFFSVLDNEVSLRP